MHLRLIGDLLVWWMLDATSHNGLHADSNLVRACAAHQISHASLAHRREENEDSKEGEEKVASEPWAWHASHLLFWQTELTDTRNFGLRQFGSEEGTSHPSRIRGVWV
jgi:hypothetical protein